MRSFAYVVPDSLAGAVDALAAAEPGTKLLAGGTTLYDLMKLGIEAPPAVIDIHRLAELTEISTGEDELSFGAGVKMAEVADHPVVRRDYPALSESLWRAASQPRTCPLLTLRLSAVRRLISPHTYRRSRRSGRTFRRFP